MSRHASVDELSAYLDRELPGSEMKRLEKHLERCSDCTARFAGLRRVSHDLHRLERMAPPPTLGAAVARRIALEGRQESLFDRLERSLAPLHGQSTTLALFGVVVALVVILLLFGQAIERQQGSTSPDLSGESIPSTATDAILETGGRTLRWQDGAWVGAGATVGEAEIVLRGSPRHAELIAAHPDLAVLDSIAEPVRLVLDGALVELR